MCDVGDHLERVQLVFAEVGSLGSLPQFNHTGLPELCIKVKHRGGEKTQSDNGVTEAVSSLSSTHTLRRNGAFKRSSRNRRFLSRYNHSSPC